MQKISLVICIVFLTFDYSFSQTGFFGKNNSVEFSFTAAPSIKRKNVLKDKKGDLSVLPKLRIINSSYAIAYNRILTNKISLSLGFNVASMHSYKNKIYSNIDTVLSGNQFQLPELREDIVEPTVRYTGISLGINFFGINGINPLGLRGGVSFEYGSMLSDYSEIVVHGTQVFNSQGSTQAINEDVFVKDYSQYQSNKLNVIAIRWNIGKNLILTRNLLLKFDFSSNLLSHFLGNSFSTNGFIDSIFESLESGFSNNNIYNLKNSSFSREEFENFRITYFGYKRFNLSLGISYSF